MRSSTINGGLDRLRHSRRTAGLVASIEPGKPLSVVLKHVQPSGAKASWIHDTIITDGVQKTLKPDPDDKKRTPKDTTIDTVEVTGASYAIVIRHQTVRGKPKAKRAIKIYAKLGCNEGHVMELLEHYVDLS